MDLIYKKIIKNNYIDENKIFRFSAHKVLMEHVQKGYSLYVPNKQVLIEFKKIYRNCGFSNRAYNNIKCGCVGVSDLGDVKSSCINGIENDGD